MPPRSSRVNALHRRGADYEAAAESFKPARSRVVHECGEFAGDLVTNPFRRSARICGISRATKISGDPRNLNPNGDTTIFTKITLTLALVFGTASVALAQDSDPNLLNRYPAYNMTKQVWSPSFETRGAALSGHAAAGGEQAQLARASWSTGQ